MPPLSPSIARLMAHTRESVWERLPVQDFRILPNSKRNRLVPTHVGSINADPPEHRKLNDRATSNDNPPSRRVSPRCKSAKFHSHAIQSLLLGHFTYNVAPSVNKPEYSISELMSHWIFKSRKTRLPRVFATSVFWQPHEQ
jgi:hypothetical protein